MSPPPSYLNRKYFFILDLLKSPKKLNPSSEQVGKSNPSPEAGVELVGQAFVRSACLWTGCLSFALSGTYCLEHKYYVPNGPSLQGWSVSATTFPSHLHALTWKAPYSVRAPRSFWPGSTAQQEQGNDQHQHCQHFEPSLLRKATILPTSSPCPP